MDTRVERAIPRNTTSTKFELQCQELTALFKWTISVNYKSSWTALRKPDIELEGNPFWHEVRKESRTSQQEKTSP
jgi:hypothetical protein